MATTIRTVSILPAFPILTKLLFLIPIAAGLFGVLLPSLGYFPDLGGNQFHFEIFHQLLDHPALPNSVSLTLFSGISATFISLCLAILLAAMLSQDGNSGNNKNKISRFFVIVQRGLIPLIAVPHAAIALGLAFLIAPSGWIIRSLSFLVMGWETPPEWVTLQDPFGLSLIFGLVLKETPYLLLMILAALPQIRAQEYLRIGQSLGYGNFRSWLKLVLPQVYPLIRLPVFAVLAFSLSVVDVALILGPTTPPTLAVLILRWIDDPDLSFRFLASAGAVLLLVITLGSLFFWRVSEWLVLRKWRNWLTNGKRGSGNEAHNLAALSGLVLLGTAFFSVLGLAFWSLSLRWPYPHVLPQRWTSRNWERHWSSLQETAFTTLEVGVISGAIALFLVVGCLENEQWRRVKFSFRSQWLLYLPLLIPQATFLLGIQILAVRLEMDGTFLLLVWSHLLFVLPYIFLTLADPWRNLDVRFPLTAQCLGASPLRILFRIKLPLLLKPLLIAAAIGFAVSVAQYLPTLFAGGGRFATLTTEAVSYAAGADRRVIGVYGFLQALFPWIALLLALAIPRWRFRNRAALS
ncbi:MAG TPA: ABC transporter permease [Candidatus Lambdaproteobacteria bacterium]|nr:ABC transporter permease [Candidatus Lambdaproteobacteria bacterium]